ncbi:signal peptidase I [Homoserinibacter sp. YIM 151385]|uniref:signal peptidase I n=1 Tax=Homoserinibacter sp. YIM 151385 TaxID=2985506 RepID=UPI0022F060B2|nr:signal peptidase I [Homoserinibacter sp. YIM 151385]WBU39174.1 signal peptidase I [Homoserinibacter sp. YIM 151385]
MADEVIERSGASGAARRRERARGWKGFLRDVVVILVAAIVISFLIKTFLIRSFYIPSPSMEPTLLVNDRIIVNQLEPGLMPVEHGDIVVFRDPGGWLQGQPVAPEQPPVVAGIDWFLSVIGLTAPDSNDHLIKRVIGLPGDTVACCNELNQLTVNGVPLEEPYIQLPEGMTAPSGVDFSVTVPEDSLWVMGDNRYDSRDSRYNQDGPTDGFVPYENVVGRAILISWPADRWTWLDNHPAVFRDVEDVESGAER